MHCNQSRTRGTSRGVRALAVALLAAATMVAAAGPSEAGGLYVNEFSTSSQGQGTVGATAWAKDASVALHNPAGMTQLDDHGFHAGFSAAFGRIRFDADGDSPSGNGNGGNQAGVAPIASSNYVHKLHDRVRLGLTLFSLSGSILDPSNNWAGRFQLTELSLFTLAISPTVAFRVTDWLSIGGGPTANYGILNWDLRRRRLNGDETNIRLDNLDDWQPSGRIGVLLTPFESLSIGVLWNSKTDFDLSGDAEGRLGRNPSLDLELPLAQFVKVGVAWDVTDALTLLATFGWEDWSEADNLKVTLGGIDINASVGFKDTYKYGLGLTYQVHEDWLLQTGVVWDTSSFSNSDRTVALPIDQQIRAAAGVLYDWTEAVQVGGSFVYVNLGDNEIRQSSVSGNYQDNDLFIFGLTVQFKKLWWSGRATL